MERKDVEERKKPKTRSEDFKTRFEDFIPEVISKLVAIEVVGRNEAIAGVIVDESKYWIKFVDANGKIVYVNKAHLKTITPLRQ